MNAPALTKFLRRLFHSCLAAGLSATAWAASGGKPDAIVAADGTGQYRTVREAIDASPQITHAGSHWTILVKPGTYRELIHVQREKRFTSLVGEDAEKTVITYDLFANIPGPDGKPIGTFRTPTMTIDADDFTVENLTLENSAGPTGQALALRVDGDRVAFRRCRLLGWQDTVLTNRGRQYFEDCTIVGAVDFIFGAATAFFERCHIRCAGDGYITAASTPDSQPYGYVFSHCTIAGAAPGVKTYLGRPWRDFARTVFLNTEMSDVVRPAGWHNWNKPVAEQTAHYAEFNSTGPGAKPAGRVPWSKQLTADEAAKFTVAAVLGGADGWNPAEKESQK